MATKERLFADIDTMEPDAFAQYLAEDVTMRFGNAPEIHGRHREAARAVGPHELAQLVEVRRAPVGRHRHHLVLVRRAAEAEVGGELLVEQPERVRQRLRGEDLERAVAGVPREVRGALAAPVDHEHR